ncbi:MAG: hypothetical protein HOY71_14225 [Nonomuraea sp.]|nr:hypothetical protein [Nonomuraea sp.]
MSDERRVEIAIALCRAYRDSENLTEAVRVGEEVLGAANRPTWSDLLVELGATLLSAYLERGDLLRARQFAAELLNASDTLGTPRSTVAAHWNAAYVADATGHSEEALTFAERAMAVQAETGQPRNVARMRVAIAQLRLRNRREDAQAARESLSKALSDVSQTSVSTVDRARTMLELARAELIMDDVAVAAEHASEARAMLPDTALAIGAEASLLVSFACASVGRTEEAHRQVASVRDWLAPLPNSRRSSATWYAAAESFETLGDQGSAVEAYQRALACAGL